MNLLTDLILPVILGALAGLASGLLAAYLILGRASKRMFRLSPPTLRVTGRRSGRRYVVFEVLGVESISFDELRAAIGRVTREAYGEMGEALMGIRLIEYDELRRRGIIRVRRDYKMHALAVLGLIRSVNGRRLLLVPLATTGSLKRARRIANS